MPDPVPTRQLPRGRHGLPRAVVVQSQRDRILAGMAEAMVEHGYVGTSVAVILKRAGVSRETFYEQFRSKEDCFDAAYERAVELLMAHIQEQAGAQPAGLGEFGGTPLEQIDLLLGAYLEGLASEPAYARLFLVEVYAVGPAAIARRALMQESFVAMVAQVLGATTDEQIFACQTLVSALSGMVTARVAADDTEGLRALRAPLLTLVRRSGDLFGTVPTGN
ncbi:TetR/AcrR family transcriptional regulator [Nocardia stercoris]|uniref:TetR/AcrR family transcriptional regulator n=1 Tax=Nocardia stercoris TaxID=2483361 RepID=A0A3M2L9S4_9NOCA|nr:TetR/AcrR family transcriptional regulator [Nocardia stercoris]RMI34164.1 TetR/AcrR family transcriptional regulator [Nocardia stercoris]